VTFRDFWARFAGGRTPHREQARYIAAVDSGTFPEALLHWGKKSGKSQTSALRGLHYLVAEERDPDDRLIGIASHDEEQSRIIFAQAAQLVARHPDLADHVRVLKNEMVFEEEAREPRTGGVYTKEHRLRALAKDQRGLHGEPWSCVLRDEVWSEPDHAMTEALIPSPARPWSEILYTTYSPLATMRKPGVPLHDLLARVAAHDPTLFYSFIGGSGDDASWTVCPWIRQEWVEQQRRIFAASPSRFRRVVLNEQVLGGEGDTLLTLQELKDAQTPVPRVGLVRRVAALDLGLSNDHAAYVDGGLTSRGRFVVDGVKVWKPEGGQISFMAIEQFIVERFNAMPFTRLNVDQWNAALLVERLRKAQIPARLVSVEQTRLNRIITRLKDVFSRRAILVDTSQVYLLEQLEALKTLETRTPRRDLLKFAPSGTGADASQHDDAAVSLGLCLIDEGIETRIGRVTMDAISQCNLAARGLIPNAAHCALAGGPHLPLSDPACLRDCAAYRSTGQALRDYYEAGGENLGGVREFVAAGLIQPCEFLSAEKFRAWSVQNV
jgi:hypothetical protein